MADKAEHPDPSMLEAFALGRLDAAAMERLASHLAICQGCGRRVQEVPNDHLIELLRRHPKPSGTMAGPA